MVIGGYVVRAGEVPLIKVYYSSHLRIAHHLFVIIPLIQFHCIFVLSYSVEYKLLTGQTIIGKTHIFRNDLIQMGMGT